MAEELHLRAFEYEDLELINRWHNDEEINSMTGGAKRYVSSEYDKKWLEDKMLNNSTNIYCAICTKNKNKIIGFISLNTIDYINRKAYWGGLLIGDKEERNKGYATNATYLMLKYGFEELGLNKITGHWLEDNKVSIILGKMMGFKQEGKLKDEVYKNGRFNNVIIMSLFNDDFKFLKENFGGNEDEQK